MASSLLRRPLCYCPGSSKSSTSTAVASSLRLLASSLSTSAEGSTGGPSSRRGSNNGGAKKAPRPLAAASSSSSTSPPPKKQLWHPKQNRAAATTNHPEKRLLQQVNSAVNYKQLPTALARLRELNALSLPLPQEQIQNAVLSVLQLCQTSVRRPQEGTDAALEILAMERLAALLDKDCMAQAFQLIDTRDPTTWAHTLSFLERVLAHLPPTAWPSQQIYRHALRHLADAGRPDEVKWVLRMMLTHGGPDRYGIGSMGRRHSPAWHLIKAYLYAHQPIAAVQLLKREEGLVLDVDTFAFVLKGLAREKLGPAAAAFLQWGEEEAGVATTTEAYNYVMIALAKANRHIIRQRYSFPPTHPLPSIAEEEGAMRRNIGLGRQMLARMRLRGVKPDMTTFCALIDAYSEARDTDGAIAVFFEEMVGKARLRPTDVAFGTLMKAFSRQTDWRRTLACLEAMHELKLEDKMEICYSTAIFACGKAYRCQDALALLNEVKAKQGGRINNPKTYTSAIYACARASQYEAAQRLLTEIEECEGKDAMDIFAYNLAVHVCARGGDEAGVLRWWEKMEKQGWVGRLDSSNTCAVLKAYGATGRFEQGLAFVEAVLLASSSSGRFISGPAHALFVLRAAQAGKGEEVVGRLLALLKKHGHPVQPFLYGACAKVVTESGLYEQGLGMSLADAPWWLEEEEGVDGGGKERRFSTADFVRTQLSFMQMEETSWPVAWWMVDGLAARGVLNKEGVEVAAAALAEKEGFALCGPRLAVYREALGQEVEEVAVVVEKEEEEEEEEDYKVHVYNALLARDMMAGPLSVAPVPSPSSSMAFVVDDDEMFVAAASFR